MLFRADGGRLALQLVHGVGAGIGHTGSTSIDLKSADETISRYSMSGE